MTEPSDTPQPHVAAGGAEARIVELEAALNVWRALAQSAMGLMRERPGWADDVPEEVRLAWWRKADDQCAAYDKFLLAPPKEVEDNAT